MSTTALPFADFEVQQDNNQQEIENAFLQGGFSLNRPTRLLPASRR